METTHRSSLIAAFAALFLSGIAGVLNQVIWQRGLRIFLGGSETVSAMIVVLVFMLGLGLGADLAGRWVNRTRNPLLAFGLVELTLFVANVGIAFLLSSGLSESIYAAQKLALSAGISVRVVYGVASLVILLVPTALMGATLPLASEACQRQFGATDRLLIPVLFFLNSVGAVVGAAGGSFYLLPFHGQFTSLIVAASMNLCAGVVVIVAGRRVPSCEPDPQVASAPARGLLKTRREEVFGLVLGFLSLGFEMILLRYMMLAHEPLPYTFAVTLCSFLLFWSVGVYVASWFANHARYVFLSTAFLIALVPFFFQFDRANGLPRWVAGVVYFLPCLGFGILYGLLVAKSANRWGTDVGRFYAFNTVGACLGILFFTLVGYEIPVNHNAWLIGTALVGASIVFQVRIANGDGSHARTVGVAATVVTVFGVVVFAGLNQSYTESDGVRTYWGRDGVVEVNLQTDDIIIDGLWHSRLSDGTSHHGRYYSWMMAVAGMLAHQDEHPTDALVVGNCIGITASTLAKVDGLHVDTYEINQTLKDVLADFPDRTLNVSTNPAIDIMWQDGRSGLALNEKKYDLVITAPRHLRAAGSSTLLSREYLALVKRRLKPGGVVVLFSSERVSQQERLIQATVSLEFEYSATWLDRRLTVASNSPIDFDPDRIDSRLAAGGAFYNEVVSYFDRQKANGLPGLVDMIDEPLRSKDASPYVITDNNPLVEYPAALKLLLPDQPRN